MGELLRQRVRERLEAMGSNPFEAARKAGFERSFVNDLLIGKKRTIREDRLPALADALDCDPEYLQGIQQTPRVNTSPAPAGLRVAGICEAGAFRDPDLSLPPKEFAPIQPDPRFRPCAQSAYIVIGSHADGMGITDGSIICIVSLEALDRAVRSGDPVIVSRDRQGAKEFTARIVADRAGRIELVAKPGRGEIAPLREGEDAKIEGLILRAIKVFGEVI